MEYMIWIEPLGRIHDIIEHLVLSCGKVGVIYLWVRCQSTVKTLFHFALLIDISPSLAPFLTLFVWFKRIHTFYRYKWQITNHRSDRWTELPIITLYGDNNETQPKRQREEKEREKVRIVAAALLVVLINYKDANLMVQLTFEYCLYYPLKEHCKQFKVSWQMLLLLAVVIVPASHSIFTGKRIRNI